MTLKRIAMALVGCVVVATGCEHVKIFSKRETRARSSPEVRRYLGEKGIGRLPHFDIPIEINDRVTSWIDFFQGVGRSRFERYLERSGRYVKWMRSILRSEGLPEDLVYIALIESGFSNHAYSRAHAVGPWQFIRSTGKLFGLRQDHYVDERRDPEKATYAACRYLQRLYREFGDWYLAMAAYNAGELRIRRAIREVGSRNFWDISAPGTRHLKGETKDYVPKFMAAAVIAKMPEKFGFRNISYQEPLDFEIAEVDSPTDLTVVSELTGSTFEDVKELNPELMRGITPLVPKYSLRVPVGTRAGFEEGYANLPKEKRVRFAYHHVRRGETLGRIARKYGVSVRALMNANGLARSAISPGQNLLIPAKGARILLAQAGPRPTSVPRVQKQPLSGETYKVIRGDSLWEIAKRHGTTVSKLKGLNPRLKGNGIQIGEKIQVAAQAPAQATVTPVQAMPVQALPAVGLAPAEAVSGQSGPTQAGPTQAGSAVTSPEAGAPPVEETLVPASPPEEIIEQDLPTGTSSLPSPQAMH